MAQKEFSVLKWLTFAPIVLGLSGAIVYFNLKLFAGEGSVIYIVALVCVNITSIVMVHFTGSSKRPVRFTAYTFEGLLILALLLNVSYSLSAQRDLSLVKQAGTDRNAALGEIAKLKSGRAQREAIGLLSDVPDVRTAFGSFDAFLFWVMVLELTLALGGLFTLYGVASIKPGMRRMPAGSFYGARAIVTSGAQMPASSFSRIKRVMGLGRDVQASGAQLEANGGHQDEEQKQRAAPSLRITGMGSGVRVRDRSQYLGHIPWGHYLAGVEHPKRPTEEEIRSLLNRS